MPDEHVTFAMPAYEPYGGSLAWEGIALGPGPTTPHHHGVMAGRWLGSPGGACSRHCQPVFVCRRGPRAEPAHCE
jgi:hypothetical protein